MLFSVQIYAILSLDGVPYLCYFKCRFRLIQALMLCLKQHIRSYLKLCKPLQEGPILTCCETKLWELLYRALCPFAVFREGKKRLQKDRCGSMGKFCKMHGRLNMVGWGGQYNESFSLGASMLSQARPA